MGGWRIRGNAKHSFQKVVVEVEAELGKNNKTAATKTITLMVCDTDEINLVKI